LRLQARPGSWLARWSAPCPCILAAHACLDANEP
jgi:hypothetical protein